MGTNRKNNKERCGEFPSGLSALLVCSLVWGSQSLWAQDQDVDPIEAEIQKSQKQSTKPMSSAREKSASNEQANLDSLEKLSDFSKLQPYENIVIIHPKYQPKTGRLGLYAGLTTLTNDPWFMALGVNTRLDYHLTERWGLELAGTFLSTSSRDSVKDLSSKVGVNTNSLVSVKNYLGLNILFNPIYGKLSLNEKKLVPFDMFFLLGGGLSSVATDETKSAATIHLGTGQTFAINKNLGFRWNLGMNTFQVAATQASTSSTRYYNVFIDFGVSYFLPTLGER